MSEQDRSGLMTPDEVRKAHDDAFAREVTGLVVLWRAHVAGAMKLGDYSCVTPTSTDRPRAVLDAACEQLWHELRPLGWKTLNWSEWSPAPTGDLWGMQASISQFTGTSSKHIKLTWSA